MGARMLHVIVDFDDCESLSGKAMALSQLKKNASHYDPAVLAAFEEVLERDRAMCAAVVKLTMLRDEMILAKDVVTSNGVLLVSKGPVNVRCP